MTLRVGVVCDYVEEGWPSMDLVAAMVEDAIVSRTPELRGVTLRPALPVVFSRFGGRRSFNADRALGRYLAYPRWLRRHRGDADVFHVVDHSYAHLVDALPAGRTVVTCHDLDAFRSLLDPAAEPRPAWFRAIARRILRGLRGAALVLCDSAAVAAEIERHGLVPAGRVRVVPLPVHDDFVLADPARDAAAARLTRGSPYVLHVGSTSPRKRLDVLLDAFAAIRRAHPELRLVRVGGALPAGLRSRAARLGLDDALIELPLLDRPTLAAVYRGASVVLLPSGREGFGLPLLEAMACGAPVAASDLPVLREVGGEAAAYVPVGDARGLASAALALIAGPGGARHAGPRRAAEFSPGRFAARLADAYRFVAEGR